MKTFKNFTTLPERNDETGLVLFCQTSGDFQPVEEGNWIECDEKEIKKAKAIKLFEIPTYDKYFGWL